MGKPKKTTTLFPKSSSRTFSLVHASQRSIAQTRDIDEDGNQALKAGMVLVENRGKRGLSCVLTSLPA